MLKQRMPFLVCAPWARPNGCVQVSNTSGQRRSGNYTVETVNGEDSEAGGPGTDASFSEET